MKIEDYIKRAQKKWGENLPNRVVMRHVGRVIAENKQLPAHNDGDGDPLIQIVPRTQESYMKQNGWQTVEWTSFVEPAQEPAEAKKVLVPVPVFENVENAEIGKENTVPVEAPKKEASKPRRRTSRK